jgi:hypothetical protein
MNVIDVPLKVGVVPDRVLPIAPPLLIKLQRNGKSASFGGSCQMA